jgi:two-component system sensor histidine kinase KdpD
VTDNSRPTENRLLVCVGPSSTSAHVINSAKKMATDAQAKWFAVYVEDPKMLLLPEAERQRATANLQLAQRLGAETVTLSGRSIAEELVQFARQHHVTKMLIGKPKRPVWQSIIARSPIDRLLRICGDIDVYVMTGEAAESSGEVAPLRAQPIDLADYGTGLLFLIMATALCFLMYPYFQLSNLIMVYLLGVTLTATSCGRGPAILISLLSVLAFDFCFVPPRWTFTVEEAQYIVTFMVMFVVALVISHLSSRMRQQAEIARFQERQAAAMHGLSRQLVNARGTEKILHLAVQYISEIFNSQVVVLFPDERGNLAPAAGDMPSVLQKDIVKEIQIARSAYDTGRMAGRGTQTTPASEILYVPLQAAAAALGVLALRPNDPQRLFLAEEVDLLESLTKQVTLALEVEYLAGSETTR